MDRPAIVIRDIHHYGDDLTVPEAIARLCDGGQVTVTVTDPAPPGGDPRGNPRHGFDITVRPALGGQPEPPPEVSWEARTFETPDSAALFAEALALASQLADLAGLGGGQAVLGQAAAIGAAHGRDAARRALARATPAACRDIIVLLEAGDPMVRDLYARPRWAASTASATTPLTWPATSASSWTATSTPPWPTTASCERPRRPTSPPPAKPSGPRPNASPATAPPSTPAPAASAARHEPPGGRKPGHRGPHREN